MGRSWSVVGSLLAAGCSAGAWRPLSEARIEAPLDVAARLRAELAAFEQAVGPGRVELREVRLVDTVRGDHSVAGGYRAGRVLLAEGPYLEATLRHELCHAVHQQEGLLEEPDPLWDEVAAGLFTEDEVYVEALRGHYRTARRQRHEAMAALCGAGPELLAAYRDACPGEPALLAEAAGWVLDGIYAEYDPAPLELGPATTLDGWLDAGFATATATQTAGVVRVGTVLGEESAWSLADGSRLSALPDAVEAAREVHPWDPTLLSVHEAGWSGGPKAARVVPTAYQFGWLTPRLFVSAGPSDDCPTGCWRRVDEACEPPDAEALFTADGGVWRAWSEGLAVRWAQLR